MNYRKEIDGLRALAVLPVIFFHAGFKPFAGGFVGVDVFFVISGYLITGLLLDERRRGTYTLARFYERRARRILPALFWVMAWTLPFAWMWLLPHELKAYGRSLIAVSLFGSNLLFWKSTSYFDHAVDLKPLLHTWSLAVEEQFYLLFPLMLGLLIRVSQPFFRHGLILFFLISLGYSLIEVKTDPTAAFYLLPCRAFELLLGSLIAERLSGGCRGAPPSRWRVEAGGILGLALILAAIFGYTQETPFPGVAALLPTCGAGLVLYYSTGQSLTGRFLQLPVLRGIGLISYSAYLWHQPLFAFARHRLPLGVGQDIFVMLSALTLVLAALSWRFIELPFRAPGGIDSRFLFRMAGIGSVFFILAGAVLLMGRGFPERLPPSSRLSDIDYPKRQAGWCFHDVWTTASLSVGPEGTQCWLGNRQAPIRAALVGDSFAGQYEPLWDLLGRRYGIAVNAITTNWCYPTLSDEFPSRLSPRARAQCLYNRSYVGDHLGDYDLLILAGDWGTEFKKPAAVNGLWTLVERAGVLGLPVIMMAAPRQFDQDVMGVYQKSQLLGLPFDPAQLSSRRDAETHQAHLEIAARVGVLPKLLFIRRDSLFQREGSPSDLDAEGVPYSLEGEHLSVRGARAAALNLLDDPGFESQLQALVKAHDRVESHPTAPFDCPRAPAHARHSGPCPRQARTP